MSRRISCPTDIDMMPEVRYMAAELEIDRDAVIGKLIRVAAYFAEYADEGERIGGEGDAESLVDAIAGIDGFCMAMDKFGIAHIQHDAVHYTWWVVRSRSAS